MPAFKFAILVTVTTLSLNDDLSCLASVPESICLYYSFSMVRFRYL